MSLDEAGIPAAEDQSCPFDSITECEEWRDWVTKSLNAGKAQFVAHQQAIANNTALTEQIKQSTDEILAAFETVKSGAGTLMKLGKWTNRFARWAVPIVGLGGLIWGLLHGQPPRIGE